MYRLINQYQSVLAILIVSVFVLVPVVGVLADPVGPPTPSSSSVNSPLKTLEGAGMTLQGQATPKKDLSEIVGGIVKVILAILGIIMLVITVYGGLLWGTAQGNDEQVGKAKKMITQGVIGVLITMGAYAITYFVVDSLQKVSGIS